MSLGRTLPHSLDSEELLLSCCLLDGADMMGRCLEAKLNSDSFYDPKHGTIFNVLVDLYNRQQPIALEIIHEEMATRHKDAYERMGKHTFLAQVSSRVPTTAQAAYFIEKVREQAMLRSIIRQATRAVEDCYEFSGDIENFVDGVERNIFAVTQDRVQDRLEPAGKIVPRAMQQIASMVSRKGEMTGVRSGFTDLDNLTWGFQRSDMIVLAARPSMGKTALALNVAENVVLPKSGKAGATLVFSLEMSSAALVQRMICSRARVNMKLLRDGLTAKNGEESNRLTAAAAEISKAPLFIDDTSAVPISHIRARARRQHARTPLSLIVVDYLQLMGVTDNRVPREQQVAEASRGLKGLAKELDVPVMVLSQLNRGVEKDNRPPRLSDLRESGAIEQDADVVLMLARPKDADDKFQVAADSTDLIVAKQRNGPVGDIKLTFLRDITRFENFHR